MLLANIFIAFWLAVFFGLIYMAFKNDRAIKMHNVILQAIRDHHTDCIKKRTTFSVDFDDMEDFNKTLRRWWDWGYKRILPKEKLEIIEKFIDKVEV